MPPIETRWPLFNWPIWARWSVTLSFLTLVNWMLLVPAGVFKDVHIFLAHQDKIAHAVIFLTLALLVRWSLPAENGQSALRFAVLAALVIYAGSIEVFQPMLTHAGRKFEWADMACNYAGVAAGWMLFGRMVLCPQEPSVSDEGESASEIGTVT